MKTKHLQLLLFVAPAMLFIGSTLPVISYPPFLSKSRQFGAKDCSFCHSKPDSGEGFNARGKWLVEQRDKRSASAIDVSWLSEYKESGAGKNAAPPAKASEPAKSDAPTTAKNDYSKNETWLCKPERNDACEADLTATVVAADGKLTQEKWAHDSNAPIDCFYVYPTVSRDTTPNSDMIAGAEELNVIKNQFARFGSKCRPYAPLYRQVTLTALRANLAGKPMPVDRALAYNDVLDAWNYYLKHDNNGRGVVLIGHSQGSGVLMQLLKNEIDGKPIQEKLISALLLGANVAVPQGKDVGGQFQKIPLCHSADQTGCVISFVSFRDNVPPPANTLFGKVQGDGMVAACTNPAALSGGSGELKAYLAAKGSNFGSSAEPKPWVMPEKQIDTAFVTVPGLLTAQCVQNEKGSYLAITVHGNPADPRTDEIPGDVLVNGQVQANWGLHLIDVNATIGNLVEIIGKQAQSYVKSHGK